MAGELESCKSLNGLLVGIAQDAFHGHPGITEELLRSQLYPEVPPEEFRPFLAKMRGILKVPRFLVSLRRGPQTFPQRPRSRPRPGPHKQACRLTLPLRGCLLFLRFFSIRLTDTSQ